MQNIGYLGLGTMGAHMAGHLLRKGYRVHSVVHRTPPSPALVDQGLILCPDLPTLAGLCEVVFTNVPDAPQIESLIFGDAEGEGLIKNLPQGAILIDNSTTSPQAAQKIATRLRPYGVEYADAPVSGGVAGAQSAKLTIMVGASVEVFHRIESLLQCMGAKITRLGEVGAGQACKAVNQTAIAGALAGVIEGFLLAQQNGLDLHVVREVLLAGAAQSKVLEFQGGRMADRDFTSRFSNQLFQKDLTIVAQMAKANAITLPMTAMVLQFLNTAAPQLDTAALLQVWERLSNLEIS